MMGFLIQSPVEHFAQTTPNHPAMVCQGDQISYRELDARSNQLANTLRTQGARPQERVAIYMHKCLDLGVAIYGVLKAGCVFVPIDPLMNRQRLATIVEDCQIQHLVCSEALAESLLDKPLPSDITLYGVSEQCSSNRGRSWADVAQASTEKPELELIDQDLGYIMYTSGSTGQPKGMMHTHHGSISYARWGARHVSMTSDDRVASHAPLHFDLSIFDFFSTAQSGATVVLVPEAVTRFPASWTKTIESERISIVFTVPYTLITMMEQGVMEQRDLGSLRWILYGGEPFPTSKLRKLMLALDNVRFTNVYGPAEAPSCTCHDVALPDEGDTTPIPIGTVSENSFAIIVDQDDRDCADGEAGELCIRSSTLTKGYWNQPQRNEAAFLLREDAGHFPAVFYRTGDRVYRDSAGILHFLGRVDRMVKVRGQRVELDEVESVLSSHPAVFEAAVFASADGVGSHQVLAAVTLKSGKQISQSELKKLARQQLSACAVPTEIAIRHTLPHNSSGKIDRKSLAEQHREAQQTR